MCLLSNYTPSLPLIPFLHMLYSYSQLTHPYLHAAHMHGNPPTYLAFLLSTAIDSAEIVNFGYKVLPTINYIDFTMTLGLAKFNIAQHRTSQFVFYSPSINEGVKKRWTIMHYC